MGATEGDAVGAVGAGVTGDAVGEDVGFTEGGEVLHGTGLEEARKQCEYSRS